MKKKLIITLIVLILLCMVNTVQAADMLKIQITLPNDLKASTQTAETKEYYEQNHIYLHATNEEQNESVMLVQLENELTTKIVSLNQLDEENLNEFLEQYKGTKEQAEQKILKQETYQKDDMLFIDTILEQKTNDNRIQTNEYYTIHEGKAVIITYSFLNKEVNVNKARSVIDSISITDEELVSQKDKNYTPTIILCIVTLILVVLYVIKQVKGKKQIDEIEKQKILPKVIAYMNKIDYSKFKGILILFVVTIILNIINLFTGIITLFLNGSMSYSGIAKVYNILSVMQNIVQLLGIIYIAYCLTKRKVKSIENIKKTFITMLLGIILLTTIRLVLTINTGDFWQYFKIESQIMLRSIVYIAIWYLYFRNSIRVSVFYGEKTLEQIIINPKKIYQENLVNKKIREFKLIEYFENQKALDYASGIYINKLPKEYAKSIDLSNLNSKKIIRLKRAKYYLSKSDLENPKTEQKQMLKIVGIGIAIYILAVLLLYSF